MRQKSTQKPWESAGMSRASWYRHGKPSSKPVRVTQAQAAKGLQISVRIIQRAARVMREAPELHPLIAQGVIRLGPAERLAALTPEQRKQLYELCDKIGKDDEEAKR